MTTKNLHVYPKTDEEKKRLIEEYQLLGYYVTSNGERITVHATRPRKVKKKDEEKRSTKESGDNEGNPKRTSSKTGRSR